MNRICTFKEFEIYQLTKDLAEKYVEDIIAALNLIPMVEKHSKEEVLAEKKGDRVLHAKWGHSLIALSKIGEFVGLIVGYERDKENNDQYPLNCIYLSDLAVSDRFQK